MAILGGSSGDSVSQTTGCDASLLTDPSPWAIDDLHFTVEGRHLGSSAFWDRIELGWEMPEPLTTFAQADAVARALALRYNGARVYRVVNPGGKVLLAYVVKKQIARIDRLTTTTEEIPADFEVPKVSDVLMRLAADHQNDGSSHSAQKEKQDDQ